MLALHPPTGGFRVQVKQRPASDALDHEATALDGIYDLAEVLVGIRLHHCQCPVGRRLRKHEAWHVWRHGEHEAWPHCLAKSSLRQPANLTASRENSRWVLPFVACLHF
eukprot:579612-Pelagomonas_calceolata.AAC.6